MRHSLQKLNTRILALAMAVMLLLCSVPAVSAAEDSGTCGDKLKWSLSGDTLTITGSGAMYNFSESTMSPWYAYRREIAAVRLPAGLTRIGDLAFYDCSALEVVSMPDSVTEVGEYAFAGCSSLVMLDLSSGLLTIDDGGFRGCTALPALRLPKSLKSIGYQGFYRCESLTEITIPASVTNLGLSAFSFCYNLVRANIKAPLTRLPSWTFYGCDRLTDVILPDTLNGVDDLAFYNCTSLSNVEYNGDEEDRSQIAEDISRDLAGQVDNSHVTDEDCGETSDNTTYTGGGSSGNSGSGSSGGSSSGSGSSGSGSSDSGNSGNSGNGGSTGVVGNTTTTTQTENASVSSSVTVTYSDTGPNSVTAHVVVTLETADGWREISDKVTQVVNYADSTTIDVYIKDSTTLAAGALADLVGKNVVITVHNATGSVWRIDCRTLGDSGAQETYDLSYERTDATEKQLELLGCAVGYQIRFISDARVDAEVMIKLPVEHARKHASLYQVKLGGDIEHLQTVVVDDTGYAHFYLASVERKTVYLIGIDVPAVESSEAIIPEVLFQDYGVTDNMSDTKYVVTGRTSSWGISLNQVTWIMVGAMASVVLIVGFIMFALNKRKLKMGYIPDLDEEDDE